MGSYISCSWTSITECHRRVTLQLTGTCGGSIVTNSWTRNDESPEDWPTFVELIRCLSSLATFTCSLHVPTNETTKLPLNVIISWDGEFLPDEPVGKPERVAVSLPWCTEAVKTGIWPDWNVSLVNNLLACLWILSYSILIVIQNLSLSLFSLLFKTINGLLTAGFSHVEWHVQEVIYQKCTRNPPHCSQRS